MLGDARTPHLVDEVLEVLGPSLCRHAAGVGGVRRAVGAAVLYRRIGARRFLGAIARIDGAHDALADDVRRQAIQRALEGVARVHLLAVDPGLAQLPVLVLAQQHVIQLQDIRVIREHDMARMVEGEALVRNRAAPPADGRIAVEQQRVRSQMVGRGQAGRSGPNDGRVHAGAALAQRHGGIVGLAVRRG
jgi:hypothetical protein